MIIPSHGKYIGASSKPMSEYKKAVGDRVGHNWRMPNIRGKRAVRHVVFDTNYWKSFVASRLLESMGDRGSLSLWGRSSEAHMLFAEHLTAEYRVKTEGRGRRVEEWKMRPEGADNHWWDGLVGCAVAAFGYFRFASIVRRWRDAFSKGRTSFRNARPRLVRG